MDSMAQRMVELTPEDERFLEQARSLLQRIDPLVLRQKLDLQRTRKQRWPWLVAMPLASLASPVPPPEPPVNYCVMGSDASCMPPDERTSARYYVLNVSCACLVYGDCPGATLESDSRLCFQDEDLFVFPQRRDVPMQGTLLSARMEVESLRILQRFVGTIGLPTLALRDGPLTLWTLQNEEPQVQQFVLRDFFQSMSLLRQAGVALGGYISYSDGREVTNSLRVWLCHRQPGIDCDNCQDEQHELCLALAKLRDRDVYAYLRTGERTELFSSSSQILEQYGEHRTVFFYLNVGEEIVRLEVPHWVGTDERLLSFLHAATLDQCQRSTGFPPYPPALQEAHEQAVITVSERRVVEEMVDRALARRGLHVVRAAKDHSKRRRGV
jgi:hypothetical protein